MLPQLQCKKIIDGIENLKKMKNKDQKITGNRIKYIDIDDDIDNGRYIHIDTDTDTDYRYHKLDVLQICLQA